MKVLTKFLPQMNTIPSDALQMPMAGLVFFGKVLMESVIQGHDAVGYAGGLIPPPDLSSAYSVILSAQT